MVFCFNETPSIDVDPAPALLTHPPYTQNPAVRAAAVSVLARFGATVPRLLPNVLVLLQRCRLDCDDEVRDRSTYYHALLSTGACDRRCSNLLLE